MRNVQRPIAEKVEQDVQYHVEVKSVSVRNVNIPVNKLKDRTVFLFISEPAVHPADGADEREKRGAEPKEHPLRKNSFFS